MRSHLVRSRAAAASWACVGALALCALQGGAAAASGPTATASGSPAPGPTASTAPDQIGGTLLASRGVVVARGDTALPKVVQAGSWLVADMTSGKVLAARDPHGLYRPASTLKLLTAATLLPRLDLTQTYTATVADESVEGSKVGLLAGATYTVDQLFYGLFLPSGNDAANALANVYGGIPATVDAMRAEAAELHADDTHVVDPSGLDAPGQFTSAYDLALFARAGMANVDFARYTATRTYNFPGKMPAKKGGARPTYQIQNQNLLLQQGFTGTIGGKTGYTTEAGRTFVVIVRRGQDTVVATLMKIAGPTPPAAEALVNWAFDNFGRPGVGMLVDPGSPPAPSEAAAAAPAHRDDHPAASESSLGGATVWLALLLFLLGGFGYLTLRRRAPAR